MNEEIRVEAMELCVTACEKHASNNEVSCRNIVVIIVMYSRLSLFWLSEVRSPRYTGHLVWHGLLARCLLHKTHPEYDHSLFCILASAGCPKLGFQCNVIRLLQPDMTLWVWFADTIGLHIK